jgi:hypothetical protein
MARVADPKKSFNFSIATPGLNPFLAQKVNVPDFELDVVKHGDTNHDIKTAGKMNFGNITMEKISSSTSFDNWLWIWIQGIQNVSVGSGLLPQAYKREMVIMQLSVDGITPLDIWDCSGMWPFKINGIEFTRLESLNTIETIEFCVDKVRKSL